MITEKKKPNKPPKEEKIEETEKFDIQFKNMIKGIIIEENYFKERDVKDLAVSILEQVEPLIAKHIKLHLSAIGQYIVNITTDPTEINRKDNDA